MFFFWGFGEVQQVLVGIGIGWLELLGAELGQLVDGGGEGGEVHGVVPGHLLGVELELERGVGVDVEEVRDGADDGSLHGVGVRVAPKSDFDRIPKIEDLRS